ncbi:MAG: host attachment family protein [Pseudomonadota bacterium]|nr:host attachment family protein [Pseudomonadota bacterium]
MEPIPAHTLVIVADGMKARAFRNQGNKGAISLHQHEFLQPVDLIDDGPAGGQPDGNTGYQTDKATFAKQLAQRLNDGALRQEYDALVLIADAQTLGEMRPLLHKEVLQRLHGELAKTLTNSPLEDIERALS